MAWYCFDAGWVIREREYVPAEESSRATVFALANGLFGCRGAGEELPANIPGVKGTYIAGIYDTPRGELTEREMPNVQDWTSIRVRVGEEELDLSRGSLRDYYRELDMRRGLMRRGFRWSCGNSPEVVVESERLVSMTYPAVGAIHWRLTATEPTSLRVWSGIDANVANRWANHFSKVICEPVEEGVYVETETFDPGYRIGVLVCHAINRDVSSRIVQPSAEAIYRQYDVELGAGECLELIKFAVLKESRFTEGNLRLACQSDGEAVKEVGYACLREQHVLRWAELWEDTAVNVEGDTAAQIGIRFAQFHLLAAAPYRNDRISIPARGLQGQDYYGSIFWDFEIFVLPMLAYTQPKAARNALMYRVHTVEGAMRKASSLGFRGAYYAWQSQETGDEQCDLYVFTNPVTGQKVRSYFADEQIHISADIVYAMWQYFEATGDMSLWEDGGARVAAEVARFFVSRSTWNQHRERYELRCVLGPDEYHERVDNNAFTNAMAQYAVSRAIEIARLIGPAKSGATEEELHEWKRFVEKLHVPQPDPESGLIPQFDGYFDLPDVPLEDTLREFEKPENRYAGPESPFQKSQNIKQADVVMLLYLLRDRYRAEVKQANWEYYEPRTAHLSSLSPMAYSLVAAEIGNLDWAYKYFIHTAHIDLDAAGPHWNLGIHAASLGGAWLAIVHGFCRLRLTSEGPVFEEWPALPRHWQSVRVPFCWHGLRMAAIVTHEQMELSARFREGAVLIRVPNREIELGPGETARVEIPQSGRHKAC